MHVDIATFLVFSAGIWVLAYHFGVVLTLLFEMPYSKLLRLFIKSQKKENNEKEVFKKSNGV